MQRRGYDLAARANGADDVQRVIVEPDDKRIELREPGIVLQLRVGPVAPVLLPSVRLLPDYVTISSASRPGSPSANNPLTPRAVSGPRRAKMFAFGGTMPSSNSLPEPRMTPV